MLSYQRIILKILIAINLYALKINSQPCNPAAGEEFYLKNKTLNLRSKPNKDSKIIKVLNNKIHSLVVIDPDSMVNNFILVKALEDTLNTETSQWVRLEELIGWVNYDLIQFNKDTQSFIRVNEPSQESADEIITEQETLKLYRSCDYNPTKLAYAFCGKGRKLFKSEDYINAIHYFNKAIEVSTENSQLEKYLSIYFRGLCKMKLNDNYGAIIDFNKITINNEARLHGQFVIGWAYKSNDHAIRIIGGNVPHIDLEDVYLNLSICKARSKKYDEALTFISKILQNNKQCGNAYYVRAQIYLNMDKKKASCIEASMAGELGINEAYEFISEYCN